MAQLLLPVFSECERLPARGRHTVKAGTGIRRLTKVRLARSSKPIPASTCGGTTAARQRAR